jgi:hypothetical protein
MRRHTHLRQHGSRHDAERQEGKGASRSSGRTGYEVEARRPYQIPANSATDTYGSSGDRTCTPIEIGSGPTLAAKNLMSYS